MIDPRIGQRVELHPATDRWMRGDRFGVVIGIGRRREYINTATKAVEQERPLRIKLDRSGAVLRFHPTNVVFIDYSID